MNLNPLFIYIIGCFLITLPSYAQTPKNKPGTPWYFVVHKSNGSSFSINTDDVDSVTFVQQNSTLDIDAFSVPAQKDAGLRPVFSLHEDDTIDKLVGSASASWMIGGYATVFFPLVECLGLKASLSMEGQRVGFTNKTPTLNYNGQIVKHLQDHHGWEIMAHSMTARYTKNNYAVSDINSLLAQEILRNAKYNGVSSMETTCVVDTLRGVNYMVNSTLTGWQECPMMYIRPYVMDYATNRVIAYNKTFPVDYQWGRLLELAKIFGLNISSGVMVAQTGSHVLYPLIQPYIPNLFDQCTYSYCNQPPLPSFVNRKTLEATGSEQNPDNRYDAATLTRWKALIDEACAKNAWLVFFMHSYRPCWLNKNDEELVSNGGTYPDEWVHPILPEDDIMKSLDVPPARLGITSWKQWHPCPGTRLYMLYELLQYAQSKGMQHVTSQQGFEMFGNVFSEGYYVKNGQAGEDIKKIEGTQDSYSHYVIGIDGSEDFKR